MAAPRRIMVITGSRAEFGLLRPLGHAIEAHPSLELLLVVTGVHLTRGTVREIEAAFAIAGRVPMQRGDQTGRPADVEAVGRGVAGLGEIITEASPDFVVVLGDRIEAFAGAIAASVGGARLVHLHGGDRAEGVADEAMRHAISKLAHIHLPATAQSRRRLIRMGEPEGAVLNVGSLAIDGLSAIEPMRDEQFKRLGIDPASPPIVVMQHPIGEADATEQRWMSQTLAATAKRARIVFAPNADPGSVGIRAAIAAAGIDPIEHLERADFIGLLKRSAAIIGNSSAALIECAALKLPAVDIGPRQRGRQSPKHVVHCEYGCEPVRAALGEALAADLSRMRHPYGDGRAAERIAEHLAALPLGAGAPRKCNTY